MAVAAPPTVQISRISTAAPRKSSAVTAALPISPFLRSAFPVSLNNCNGSLPSYSTAAQSISPFLCCAWRVSLSNCNGSLRRRHGLIPLNVFKFRSRNRWRYDHFGASGEHSLWTTSSRRADQSVFCTLPSKLVVPDYAFNEEWLEAKARQLASFLRTFTFRRQWIFGTVILAGVLVSKSLGGFVAFIFVCVTTYFLKVDREKLNVNSTGPLETFINAISKVARSSEKFTASVLSSSSHRKARVPSVSSKSSGWDLQTERPNNPSSKALVRDCTPDAEAVVTDIAQSVAHLMRVISSLDGAVITTDIRSVGGVLSVIGGLRRDLRTIESSLIVKEGHLRSRLLHGKGTPVPITVSGSLRMSSIDSNCEDRLNTLKLEESGGVAGHEERISSPVFDQSKSEDFQQKRRSLSGKYIPTEETSGSLSSSFTRLKETISPLLSKPAAFPVRGVYELDKAPTVNGTRVRDRNHITYEEQKSVRSSEPLQREELIREGVNKIQWEQPNNKSVAGEEISISTNKLSSVAERKHSPSSELSGNKNYQVVEVQATRKGSILPDPWRNDSTGPKLLGSDDEPAILRENCRDEGNQLLDLVLIERRNSRANPGKDDLGKERGIHASASLDFWQKSSGSVTNVEQGRDLNEGTATGMNDLQAVDDSMGKLPRDSKRELTEEEMEFLRTDPIITTAGRQWDRQRPEVSGRKSLGPDQELWENEHVADDNKQGKTGGSSQNMQGVRDLDIAGNIPLIDGGRSMNESVPQSRDIGDESGNSVYSGTVDSTLSTQERNLPGALTDVPPKLREMEDGKVQAIAEAKFRTEKRVVNIDNEGGLSRTSGAPQGSDREIERGSEVYSSANRRIEDSLYTPTDFGATDHNAYVEQSKRMQIGKLEGYLDEGATLLDEGTKSLDGRIEVGVAECLLSDAARLFESAAELDPTNLAAVGLWGNTLLVHGQLKLNLSQRLRSMLPSPQTDSPLVKGKAIAESGRQSLKLTLLEICEDCEELLVDAGRKYRRALSLDRTDVRALYNWGLALCYRGQLIADEGSERAMQDADKVYLAAIDKFEAMVGLTEDYKAGALLNWGLALRDRSRLRAMGDKERVQLLLQAKGLFQDAMRLDLNCRQARGAITACVAELSELERFEALQRRQEKRGKPPPTRNWWQNIL